MEPTEKSFDRIIDERVLLLELGFLPAPDSTLGEMRFVKNGVTYDLSAADILQLDRIERDGLFVVDS